MKRLNLYTYVALLVLVALFTSCSAPHENSGSPNTGATQEANSNSAPQPQIAQSNAPAEAPVTVPPAPPAPAPAEKSAATIDATPAKAPDASATPNARVPKLVIPEKKIDFGKQPQDKTLVRAIVVKNGGRADLSIESVVPS
ncbi:MAG TPA: hypothetical protein VLG74_07590 [Blastocatellia bacterium]|nr:hypothetical protein [Blastocatellia bacterium]